MDAAQAAAPELVDAANQAVFTAFGNAFGRALLLWFLYESIITMLTNGYSLGKLLFGLRIVPVSGQRNELLNRALMLVRGAAKVVSLYLFQGIPFFICGLTVLANGNRSGFDMVIRTKVINIRNQAQRA